MSPPLRDEVHRTPVGVYRNYWRRSRSSAKTRDGPQFWGAMGLYKNPVSHRRVEYADPTVASEIVLLADLLLRILDGVEDRQSTVD
jgi:hypothetical protein